MHSSARFVSSWASNVTQLPKLSTLVLIPVLPSRRYSILLLGMRRTYPAGADQLQPERARRLVEGGRVVAPVDARHVDEQLDLVAVGVEHVEAVADGVVGAPDQRHQIGERLDPGQHLAQLVVAVTDLESEVIEADPTPARDL